jgi:hypothetical protein
MADNFRKENLAKNLKEEIEKLRLACICKSQAEIDINIVSEQIKEDVTML